MPAAAALLGGLLGRPAGLARRVLARAAYRVSQVLLTLSPTLHPHEVRTIRDLLAPPELVLFLEMQPRDRRHAMNVLRGVVRAAEARGGEASRALQAAALLHDVGKVRGRPGVFARSLFVVLRASAPWMLAPLASSRGRGLRHALWVLLHHAELGADLLARAGSDPRLVELVARSEERDAGGDAELGLLLAVDDSA